MELVEIKGVGPVFFQLSKKAKRLSIKLKPFEPIKVVVPATTHPREALSFVNANRGWILENLAKIKEKENDLTIFDESTEFKTRSFALKIQKAPIQNVRIHLRQGILSVEYPHQHDVKSTTIQEHIRYGIEEALRVSAKNYLPHRLHQLAKIHGFHYNRVFIKNLKSRWGSCSHVNNINLNLHLMRLPDHLIDSVLLHELCHTVEKNHGPGFWGLMNKVTDGKAKMLDKEMKNYRTVIY
ncbi:M48 family metallopeptidase [Plebeiibacterium sediminum]|uniref:M48 family metallopeptidase n=1 Tax=Plebeiibacterium sediminum TaxID=2992112 RepID=A0AAE3SFB7_9BACT|nr:SprT family zinc-dependent metalloprotease [Plebeiobacterium sediminum]MCW3787111.1 M48 family metallopeptidase [Plebeiobacterium sediminum]